MDNKNLKGIGIGMIIIAILIVSLTFFDINLNLSSVSGYVIVPPSNTNSSLTTTTSQTSSDNLYLGLEHLPSSLPSGEFSESSFNNFLQRIMPYEQFIREAAAYYNVDEKLIRGIMRIENGGKPYDTGTYTIKDGSNSKIKVKRLCNGRCGLCKFAGGPGNEYNCKELDKQCWYFDSDQNEWIITSSTGYCSLMQTNIARCDKLDTCDTEQFLAGSPRDSIFAGAQELNSLVKAYNKFVQDEAIGLPEYNIYWAVAFGYNNGVGSMRTAIRKITLNKYGGDYSKFKWWEVTVGDFEKIMSGFAPSVSGKPAYGRAGYPLSVLKAVKLQIEKGYGGAFITTIPTAAEQQTLSKISTISTPDTVPVSTEDRMSYQISPSFTVYLTNDIEIYARLREKAFLMAKDVEKCVEESNKDNNNNQNNLNDETNKAKITETCVNKIINENKNINLPPKTVFEVCDKDNKNTFVICARTMDNLFVSTGTIHASKPLIYKFALGFSKAGLKDMQIKDLPAVKADDTQTQPTSFFNASQLTQINVLNANRHVGVFGDSITKAGGDSKGYVTILNNKGIGKFEAFGEVGASSSKIKANFFEIVKQHEDAGDKFDEVIIFAGVNNICNMWTKVKKDLAEMYAYAKGKGTRVGAITLLPFKGYSSWNDECYDDVINLNNWIMNEANVDFRVNIYQTMADPNDGKQIISTLTSDHLHPNTKGHEIIADNVFDAGYKQSNTQVAVVPSQLTKLTSGISSGVSFYTYQTKCPSEVDKINSRMEGIIVPEGVSNTPDIYFYFHGMHPVADEKATLVDYNCISKGLCENMANLKSKGKDAVMVMFTGAKDSSEYSKWMSSGFTCFYDEALANLKSLGYSPQNMVLMGHSGGGKAIKNVADTFLGKQTHLPLKAVVYYDACYGWCSAILDNVKALGAKMFSTVTLDTTPGGQVSPRKNDFEALTGVDIDASTPNVVYTGVNNDQDVNVLYAKNLGHDQIPDKCFYNFLEQGQCVG